MLNDSNCELNECKWYCGVIQPDGTEQSEEHFCGAFPKGIPRDIAYGEHTKIVKGQAKKYVFEKDEDMDNHYKNLPKEDVALQDKINAQGSKKTKKVRR